MNRFRLLSLLFLLLKIASVEAQPDTLHLLFAGDVMGHGPMIQAAKTVDGYDYDPFFEFIKPLISQADFAVANLELTLPGKPPYTGYPMFRSPDELAVGLKNAGFDMLVTSNNHANDGGLGGVTHTIDVLRELEIHQTGTFKTREERDIFYPKIVYIKSFKIVFLNATYDTNGLPDRPPSLVNRLDTAEMFRDFQIAKALGPDFIIPILHWGIENQLKPNDDQRFWASKFIEWGADLIIGAHPHVVQPIERQRVMLVDGSEKEVVVAWSLGNFISNQLQPNADGGIVFHAILTKKKGAEKAELTDFGFTPHWRFIQKTGDKTTYLSLPPDAADSVSGLREAHKTAMEKFYKQTRKQLFGVREF